jgi:hypothetical protein
MSLSLNAAPRGALNTIIGITKCGVLSIQRLGAAKSLDSNQSRENRPDLNSARSRDYTNASTGELRVTTAMKLSRAVPESKGSAKRKEE